MILLALLAVAGVATVALGACSASYNWRAFHSPDGTYSVLFPDKPAELTRVLQLDGRTLSMSMHGAEIGGVSFTVSNAQLQDAAQAEQVLRAMRSALVRNIAGVVVMEKASTRVLSGDGGEQRQTVLDVRARGTQNGMALLMVGRFTAHDARVFQLIVLGPEKDVSSANVDTFMASFKAQ